MDMLSGTATPGAKNVPTELATGTASSESPENLRARLPQASDDPRKHIRCESYMEHAIKRSPFVKFMLDALQRAGCPFERKHFICEPCDNATLAGGFVPTAGIVMCENHVLSQSDFNNVITHELIHAYDHCRAKVEWTNCIHHACSEIRAANLSGDCFFSKEQHQVCVKRRALLSVSHNPNCAGPLAKEAVDAAFASCFADTAPFERIP